MTCGRQETLMKGSLKFENALSARRLVDVDWQILHGSEHGQKEWQFGFAKLF